MQTDLIAAWLSAWDNHDGHALAAIMTDDGIYESVPSHRTMTPLTIVEHVAIAHGLSSDFSQRLISTQHDGDKYAIEWEQIGTNDGPIAESLPASGRSWKIRGASIGLTEGGKIKVHRDYWDLTDWLTQLGIRPLAQVDWFLTRWSYEAQQPE